MMKGIDVVSVILLLAFAFFSAATLLGLILAFVAWSRAAARRRALSVCDGPHSPAEGWMPPMSLAIPASADPALVCQTITAAIGLNLPSLEVIVVCDSSRRAAFQQISDAFGFSRCFRVYRRVVRCARIRAVHASAKAPRLLLVDKQEAGFSDAVNAALNVAAFPLFAILEPGMRLDPAGLRGLLREWVEAPETTAMVAAPARTGTLLDGLVRNELSLPSGQGWTALASAVGGAGSFVTYRKRPLELAGGFSTRAINPRVDAPLRVVEKLRRLGIRARSRFHPEVAAMEPASPLIRAVRDAHAGLLDSLSRYGFSTLRHGSGGERLAIAYLAVFEIFAPIAELAAYIALPVLAALGYVDATSVLAAAALIFGGPILRTAVPALRDRGSSAAGRLALTVLSPFLSHQAGLWGRLFGHLDALTSRGIRRPSLTALPQPVSTRVRAPATASFAAPAAAVAPPPPPPLPPPEPIVILEEVPSAAAPAPAPAPAPPAPAQPVVRTAAPAVAEESPLPEWMEEEPPAEHHTGETSLEMPAVQQPAGEEPLDMDVMDFDAVAEATRGVGALIGFGPVESKKAAAVLQAMSRSPLFMNVAESQRHELLFFLVIGEAKAGQLIVREGEPVHALFMVVSGEVEASSKSVQPYALGPGRTFGLASTAPSLDFMLNVRAKSDACLVAIRESDLASVAELFPSLNLKGPDSTVFLPTGSDEGGEPLDLEPVEPATAGTEKLAVAGGEDIHLRRIAPEEAHHVLAAIARSPIFCVLPTSKYGSLLHHFRLADVKQNTTLLRKGGPPTALFMVVKGELRVAGESLVLGPGQCVGVISTKPPAAFGSTIETTVDSVIAVMLPDSVTELALLYPVLELSEKDIDIEPTDEMARLVETAVRRKEPEPPGPQVSPPPAACEIDSPVPFKAIPQDQMAGVQRALAKNPLFAVVPPADRSKLLPSLRIASVDAGSTVLAEGKPVPALYLVVEGRLRFLATDARGTEHPVATLQEGETYGEMALLTGDPAGATLQAEQKSSIAALSVQAFQRITESLPVLGLTLARVIAQRLASISASITAQLQGGLIGRLDRVPAASLVQAIDAKAQSGTLFAQKGDRSIVAEFQNGQLTEARTDSGEGIEVFNKFMSWTSGSFKFVPSEPAAEPAEPARAPLSAGNEPFSVKDPAAAAIALSRLPFFAGLEPDQISDILRTTWKLYPEAGEVLLRDGQPSEALYVIGKGTFEEVGADGKILSTPGPGECFGEMSILTDQAAKATVRAKTAGSLLAIPRDPLVQLVARIPALGAALARVLSGRLVKASRVIDEQLRTGVPGKLETISPPELIQALRVNGRSGRLVVTGGDQEIELDLVEGQVRDARAGDVTGEEAFFRFLDLQGGEFRLEMGRGPVQSRIDVDSMTLLFRGLQRHPKPANS